MTRSRFATCYIGRITKPVRSLGVKNVDFGGISRPSRAVRSISAMLTGRISTAPRGRARRDGGDAPRRGRAGSSTSAADAGEGVLEPRAVERRARRRTPPGCGVSHSAPSGPTSTRQPVGWPSPPASPASARRSAPGRTTRPSASRSSVERRRRCTGGGSPRCSAARRPARRRRPASARPACRVRPVAARTSSR